MDACPVQSPTGLLQRRKAWPEEGRAAPAGPGPAGLAADQRAALLSVQILSAPAQRVASAPHFGAGVPIFPPFLVLRVGWGGWGLLGTSTPFVMEMCEDPAY